MNPWIEAMRLRTLPVSVAGVIGGTACAISRHGFSLLPAIICLVFAIIAQIISNFANEYYDFKNGIDKKGREGFRRGVTEGDIKPESMKKGILLLMAIDALLGCSLIIWGGWWLIFVGLGIGIFALAYSTGPWPLSHHGCGDIAVIIFFGLVPVLFTEYVQTQVWPTGSVSICTAFAIGLMAVNVLIVNNYRDMEDDRAVNKHTTVVLLGRRVMGNVYFANGCIAAVLLAMASSWAPFAVSAGWLTYILFHIVLWERLRTRQGKMLNHLLKATSLLLLGVTIYQLVIFSIFASDFSY